MMANSVRGIARNIVERRAGFRGLTIRGKKIQFSISAQASPWPVLRKAGGIALQRLKWGRNKRRNFRKAIRRTHAA